MKHNYDKNGGSMCTIKWLSYPRPQLRRKSYISLNGPWELNGQEIQVPFAPQSRLAKYEDTGVTPKEIMNRQKRYIYLGTHFGGPAYQCPVCKTSLVGMPPDGCPACGTGMEIDSIPTKK